ncbi:MAG: ORF6N domain-containing protein [Deltaproteobacteria bacterium]|nr:MAG: ORF6N domain-containing protein [Deltaproteobacteria bacterium]
MSDDVNNLITTGSIEQSILWIRGQKVMLDSDLARLYGVTTKRLNEQVKRNRDRFPIDFMFQCNADEKMELVANCDRFKNLKHSTSLPFVFTEHGVVMLASVLNSMLAVHASVQIVRAFVRLREILTTHKDLARKLAVLENKYDHQFKVVFDAIRKLMAPPALPPKRRIGF